MTTHTHTIKNSLGYFKTTICKKPSVGTPVVVDFTIEFSMFNQKYKITLGALEYTKASMDTLGYALAPSQFFKGVCKSDFDIVDGYLEVRMDIQKSLIFKYPVG